MEWISVEERLPECDDKYGISKVVWCCDAWGRIGFAIYENGKIQLRQGAWFTGGSVGEDSVKITHWMYLPYPPTVREQNYQNDVSAQTLKMARKIKRISIRTVADIAQVSCADYSHWEQERKAIPIEKYEKLMVYLEGKGHE